MRFTSASAVLATLAVTTLASPISKNPNAPSAILEERDSINDCEDSSFNNDTSDASPLVSDCLILASNISPGGTWPVWTLFNSNPYEYDQLASFGTCAFGARSNAAINVGNQDIIDLIHSSIDMFQSPDGKVGADGQVDCQNQASLSTNHMWWGIYHT